MSASSEQKNRNKKPGAPEIPLAEWIVGAVGAVIVLFAIGVLIHEAIAGDSLRRT